MKPENKCESIGFKHLWQEKERDLAEIFNTVLVEGVDAKFYKKLECLNCGLTKEAHVAWKYSDGRTE